MGRRFVCFSPPICSWSLTAHPTVPVYDARSLCAEGIELNALQSYRKGDVKRLGDPDIEAGSFVGVVYCARWVSVKGKERVLPAISEVYLLANPAVNGSVSNSLVGDDLVE